MHLVSKHCCKTSWKTQQMKKGPFVRISTRVAIWWPTYSNRPGSLCQCDFYSGLTWRVACVADVISFWLVTSAKQHRYPCSGPPEQVRFEFPFTLIGILTMTYLKGQSRRLNKSWYIGGGPEQSLRRCFAEGLIFDFFKKRFGQMLFFQFQSIIHRHAIRFHMENYLSLSR